MKMQGYRRLPVYNSFCLPMKFVKNQNKTGCGNNSAYIQIQLHCIRNISLLSQRHIPIPIPS